MSTNIHYFTMVLLAVLAGLMVSEPVSPVEGPEPLTGETRIEARYSSSILIFKVGEITLSALLEDESYSANTHVEAAGLAALFTDFDIRAEVSGVRGPSGTHPDHYSHIERTGDKVRAVDMSYDQQLANVDVDPPFGSLGLPPATRDHKTGTVDPMSALFLLSEMTALSNEDVCSGQIPVFDGKSRYDLRLEAEGYQHVRTRGWRGEALICQVWYEPIAGYDPEDYPSQEELSHPLTVWLAPFQQGQIHIPVRLHTRAGFGGVTIQVTQIEIQEGELPN